MTPTSRRTFLAQTLGASGILALSSTAQEKPQSVLLSRMKWLNQPASWRREGKSIIVRSRPKTDFWRKTFYGYVTDNGHFFHLQVSGDFIFEARIAGQYAALYDQGGLMVRIDAENWVKCGAEFVDGAQQGSVVFTRQFSDWSSLRNIATREPVWWRAIRKSDSLETLYSLDGKQFISARLGYLVPSASALVGVMCAAPEGPGFESTFDQIKLTKA